ncbi:tetratricopeptide repeat protein [Chitinophaga cymbidii]|uniref:Uncharacterized protein n=1 Tax=Chitinophaga cymbidii TaxID=1096750 RepID=A0A512RR09_9BACT|nr:tetratricopeptide repeat protein [Chitinophaga cymbidii]GEP98141.1 hypothetical protein CCY01nite_44010 [Chitinophaga cymbidii]
MKLLPVSFLLILFAACQQPAREAGVQAVEDSLTTFIRDMRVALEERPQDDNIRMYLANALIESGQYAAADSQAIIFAKDSASLDKAFYIKALIALNRNDTIATIAHLTKAIAQAGDRSEYQAVMMNADLLLAKHQPKEAAAYYLLAQKLDSTSAEAQYGFGRTQEILLDRRMAADRYLLAIRLDPSFSPAYIRLGQLAEREKDIKEAFRYYNLAAKADPTDAEAFYFRGRTFLQLGNKPAGLDDLTKALSFRKDYPEAKALLDSAKANNFQ